MKRDQVRRVGIIGAGIAAAAAAWFFLIREPAPKSSTSAATAGASSARGEGSAAAAGDRSGEPGAGLLRWEWERDRQGALRLDGQVVNEAGEPVNDAMVVLSTMPPAVARTQADGSFTFDKLVGRSYELSARAGTMVGSTYYKLTSTSDPVVLRVRAGATLAVQVMDEADQPIRGAKIALRRQEEFGDRAPTALTGADGKALLRGVESGWTALVAEAPGFATTETFTMVGSPLPDGSPAAELTVSLSRGVAVAGQVVDEGGQPVAGARVSFDSRGRGGFGTVRRGVAKTDERGAFRFAALAPDQYTFQAMDGEHVTSVSEPVDVAGQPVDNVRLTVKAGGVVTGSVVDGKGAPVPFAVVRSASASEAGRDPDFRQEMAAARQATADASGAFELRGLPRARLQLRGEGEAATSVAVEVSLLDAAKRDGVKLVLDIDGVIAGVVVDDKGEPVAEMPVRCAPDSSGRGMAFQAGSSTTSDGSGAFTLRGLPEDRFRVWVERDGATAAFGIAENSKMAKTGDRDVRIVVKPLGRVVGKLVTSDGKPPALAKLSLSHAAQTITRDGSFVIADVEPTKYDLLVRGPDFPDLAVRDVEVSAGKDTDLGTLTLARGRRVTGTVVDADKRPVAGAKVRAGRFLLFESGSDRGRSANADERLGIVSTTSDGQGAFSLSGLAPDQPAQIAAETANGRSAVVTLAPGQADPAPVTLQLRGFGSIAGVATINGKPSSDIHLHAQNQDGKSPSGLFTSAKTDGSYSFDRVPDGNYEVRANRAGAMSSLGATGEVKVSGGRQSKLDLDIKSNNGATLTVEISALPNQRVDMAHVACFEGTTTVATGAEMMGGARRPIGTTLWTGNQPPEFDDLKPGPYTVCAVPITGDMGDPRFMERVFENMKSLAAICKPVTVTAAPAQQTFPMALPAMKPLPEPPAKK